VNFILQKYKKEAIQHSEPPLLLRQLKV